MGGLEGKTAVVAGGTSGNGWAAAKRFMYKPFERGRIGGSVSVRPERPSGRLSMSKVVRQGVRLWRFQI
jgi:NAD(P)-dependent dehydrogenase (short-subunit alcohol dehydrogenase family)